MYQKKFMSLIKVLKTKVTRAKDKFRDLEQIVNAGTASATQKQEYVELKSKIETLEDVIDLAEGMTEE
jgi:hypothetical protein